MKMKRFLSLFLITVLVIGLLPAQALWASAAATDAARYLDADGIEKFAADYTLVDSDTTTMSNGWYVIKKNITVTGTITVTGEVHLILCDYSSLTVAGVNLNRGNSLTIYAQSKDPDTMGSLSSTSSTSGQAGIGGYKGGSGTLVINGGYITAETTKSFSAGIGCGSSSAYASAYTCDPITINGGVVSACGGANAAAIGGSMNSNGATVTVNGGIVTAIAARNGSGIGGGRAGNGGNFTQNGGVVIAKAGHSDISYHAIPVGNGANATGTGTAKYNGGITFLDVAGKLNTAEVTLDQSFEIPSDYTLTVESGQTLTIAEGGCLTVSGTLVNNGTIVNNGGILNQGTFTNNGSGSCGLYAEAHPVVTEGCVFCGTAELPRLSDGVYYVSESSHLYWIAQQINDGSITDTVGIELVKDITLPADQPWTPIALPDGQVCNLNGNGHTLTIEQSYETASSGNYGLFASLNYSSVKNLVLKGSITCNTTGSVGAIAGSSYRTSYENIVSFVTVTNTNATSGNAGGIAGYYGGKHDTANGRYSKLVNCAVYADVTGFYAGGLIGCGWNGTQYYDITGGLYAGNVTATSTDGAAGAIVGYQATDSNTCTFTNVFWNEADGLDFYGKRDTENQVYSNTSAKTAEAFASGEVTWIVNNGVTDGSQAWYQHLDVDAYPMTAGPAVYFGYTPICIDTQPVYSNAPGYLQDTPGDHTYAADCDSTCKYCDVVRETTVDHVSEYQSDGSGHWQYCSVCQESWNYSEHSMIYEDTKTGLHNYICEECGYIQKREDHWIEVMDFGDGTHVTKCIYCGLVYSVEEHELVYKDNGDGTHSLRCSTCDYIAQDGIEHTIVCTDMENGTHMYCCDICDYAQRPVSHTIVCKNMGDGTHKAYCDSCTYTDEPETHLIGYRDMEDGTHIAYCYVCDYAEEPVPHTIVYSYMEDGTHLPYCDCCYYSESYEPHTMISVDNGDGTHTWKCKQCAFATYTEEHFFEHKDCWDVCSCGLATENYDNHSFGANGFCTKCDNGYQAAVWNEEKSVYEISNAGQLYWYAQYLNTTNAEVYAELTADIVIPENAPNWEPINASYVYFNGNFHTISGLKCVDTEARYVGLFGCEGWWYEISNLHITNSYFEGTEYVGAVVACMTNGGSVTNCAVTDTTVKGDYYAVGGLIGNLSSSHAINCFSTATVIGGEGNVLIGSHSVGYGSIENCYFLGTEDNYDGTTAMTAEDFASGKVAYLLQSGVQGEDIYDDDWNYIETVIPEIWGQTIGEDAYPVLGGAKVYQITDCDGETGYRNVNVSGHIFMDATCTDPKTCKVCGETEGEALGHKWAAATCTAPKTCSVCGATEGDALGHDWIDATCTTPKTCDICGATEGDAPGHSYDNGFCVRCDDYEAATGSGTAADPYKIGNAGQLYWFAAQINGGNTGIYGQLTADIVVNTNVLGADFALNEGTYRSWTPIGSNAAPYTGTFDGKEFTISGLYFEQGGQMYIGLFGRSKGTIQNVGVKDSFFYASSHIGAIAGCSDGTIRNCFNSGYVCGNWNVAGIVGMNYGDIFNCRNSGKIAGDWKEKTNPENRQIGGIAGYSDVDTLITDCRNTGDISGKNEVGGIVGKYYMMLDVHGTGSVSGCYNSGTVIGAENKVGGIVGDASVNITDCHNSGNICGKTSVGGIQGQGTADMNGEPYDVTDCSNLGEITGTGSNVGGISGYGYNTFRCFNSGAITGNSNVGGITGFSYLNITNCYNTGSVSGTKDAGGLAGTSGMMITNCYNTGVITAETNAGGIVGFQDPLMEWVCIINCYYLTGTAAVGSNSQFEVGTAEEKADFANGEVAYLLSQGEGGDVWGQTIGQDAIPNFTGMTVYPVLDCKDEIAGYSNTEGQKLGHSEPEYINNGDTHTIDYPCCDALDVTGQAHTYGDNFHCVCGKACPDGIFKASNGDLYYVENGAAVENKGLVQVIDENGLIVYYYFGCGIEGCSAGEDCQGNFKAQKSSRHYVNFTNGYLVEGGYTFNADGTIEHFENRQGIQTIDGTKFYLIDGVKVAAGLVEIDGAFYYVRSSGALVIGQDYYVSKPNGLTHNGEEIKKGTYTFDAEGRIDWTLKNGIYAEDGSLYYYVDDVRTYAGLILYTGDLINADGSVTAGVYNNAMIYVNTHGEVKNNCTYWISKNNGLIEKNRAFTFDANGIVMAEKDGFCFENGTWYYYVDGKLNYAGLIWCDGPEGNDPGYYYVNSKGMLITDCTYWISKNNGHMGNQAYTFGENGKLVQKTNDSDALLNGIVEENGELYYYENGVRTYAGLIVVDGNYYYANSQGQIVRNGQYWISRTNGYLKAGSYIFDGDGVLILD